MSPEEFDDFTRMMVVHTLEPGQAIVKQGETGKSVYVIATGSVKVWTTNPAGERLDLAVLGASDFFGEIAFLTGKPRTATVETAEDSVILEVTEDSLKELVLRRPRILQRLQEYSDMRSKGTSDKVQASQKTRGGTPARRRPRLETRCIGEVEADRQHPEVREQGGLEICHRRDGKAVCHRSGPDHPGAHRATPIRS